jgi:hypothetical protein
MHATSLVASIVPSPTNCLQYCYSTRDPRKSEREVSEETVQASKGAMR